MKNKLVIILICVLSSLTTSVNAQVGKVLFAVGETHVIRDSKSVLKRGDLIKTGDTLITGEKSRLQILFNDKARMSLRANSELVVDEYIYNQPNAQANIKTNNASSLSLIKGGFRTITGAVAAGKDKSAYQVKTAVATIGIRGTDYSILYCKDDCEPLIHSNDNQIKNGLYAGVSDGAIVLMNQTGELFLGAQESGYVESQTTEPEKMLGPPASLFGQTTPVKSRKKTQYDGNDDIEADTLSNEQPIITTTNTLADNTVITELENQNDDEGVIAKTIINDNGDEVNIDDGTITDSFLSYSIGNRSNLVIAGFTGNAFSTDGELLEVEGDNITLSLSQSSHKNVGNDQISGFSWGRWQGGQALLNDQPIDLSNQSLHWLTNDFTTTGFALVQTGSASYQLIGNTDPTNNLGERGVLGSAQFNANFTTQMVTSSLALGISGDNWRASGSASLANGLSYFNGQYDSVLINGNAQGEGAFSGFFSPNLNNENIPTGVGLTYSLINASNQETVNGVVVFGKPK